jgi:amylosucrase
MGAPKTLHEFARACLDAAGERSPHRIDTFALRLDRYYDDAFAGLAGAYADDADTTLRSLIEIAAAAYVERPADLQRLDERRLLQPDWLQAPQMVGYACYADRFASNLAGIAERLEHLGELGVTYLHLMPLLKPREGDNDGGYAVADYGSLRPDLGTMDDLSDLTAILRDRGISLCVDLVLNHVAREHAWAEGARAGDECLRDYFLVFEDREQPDAFERTLPEVFPDFAPGNFTWDEALRGWVWTTFNEFQWDLNWANPAVMLEFARIILDLANRGVEVVRLDAIAFLWKRLGTDCQNQPEVHAITQALRAIARIVAPALAFKAEAIVGPRDLVQYLGTGRHAGRVSDLAYHNSLMVQVWSMLAAGNTVLAKTALRALPPEPGTGTWITYVRCHDDIGWAIDDGDALRAGVTGHGHRAFLSDWYSGQFGGSWADGLVFQANPVTGDRRISGTTASLLGLEQAPGRVDEAALARFTLAHAVIAGWGGIPVLWSGDEFGQANDAAWAAEPGHEDDNRWSHRPRLDWTRAATRHDPQTVAGATFAALSHLTSVRRSLPQLHAGAPAEVLPETDDGVLAVCRRHAAGAFVGVYNVTDQARPLEPHLLTQAGITTPYDALSGRTCDVGAMGLFWLPPYAAWWVINAP